MSYSFQVTAANKADAIAQAKAKVDEVVAMQPNHDVDQHAAKDAIQAFVNMVADPVDGENITVNVNGSLGWSGTSEAPLYNTANFNVSVSKG